MTKTVANSSFTGDYDCVDWHKKIMIIMKSRGLRVCDIARQLEEQPNTVSRWIRGEVEPKLENAVRLAKAVGVSLDVLYDEAFALPETMTFVIRHTADEDPDAIVRRAGAKSLQASPKKTRQKTEAT